MRKIHRGSSPAEGEPLSAGRVEYLEAARQRARSRRLRRGAIIVAVLTVLVLFATGAVGTSIARAKDLVDSVHITLTPNTGWPQQTGITEPTAVAKLLVYSPSMEQQLSWSMTSNDGTPLRMAFSPDSRKLAAAAVTVSGGQVMTNLYLINLASGDPVSLVNQGGVPQWLGWTSASTILAVYDTRAVLYNAGGGERAVYDFAGTELKDVSVDAAGNVALLLASGQVSQAVTLDKNLNVQFSAAVSAANSIVRAGNLFYLLADNAVECFDASGTQQWSQNLDTSPQALLANSKDLLLFSGNTVQKLEAPAE